VNASYNVTKFTPQSYAVSVGIGVGVNVGYNINRTYVQLLWVSGGTSSEASSTPDDCVNSNDVGNVRLSSAGCEWVTYDTYQTQDDDSSYPSCSEGAHRTQCTYYPNFNQWSCDLQEGNEYEEYETCEVV
jgi:hypothetical protein